MLGLTCGQFVPVVAKPNRSTCSVQVASCEGSVHGHVRAIPAMRADGSSVVPMADETNSSASLETGNSDKHQLAQVADNNACQRLVGSMKETMSQKMPEAQNTPSVAASNTVVSVQLGATSPVRASVMAVGAMQPSVTEELSAQVASPVSASNSD